MATTSLGALGGAVAVGDESWEIIRHAYETPLTQFVAYTMKQNHYSPEAANTSLVFF